MANKRVFKLATASAVAASALVAAVPASAASVTYEQAEKQVNKAREAANGLHALYTRDADYVTQVDSKEARDELARAKAKIAALSSAKEKAYLSSRIQGTIDTVARANAYNNAVRAGGFLGDAAEEVNAALANGVEDLAAAQTAQEKLNLYYKVSQENFGKVYGKEIQANFKKEYITEDLVAFKANAYYGIATRSHLVEADKAIKANDVATAEKYLGYAQASVAKITVEGLKDALTASWTKLSAELEAIKVPKVESVSAINAKQIVVTFNVALAESVDATAVNAAFTLEGADDATAATVDFSKDRKSVTITVDTAEVSNGKLTVLPLDSAKKNSNGVAVKTTEYNTVFSYTDKVAPVVAKTEFTYSSDTVADLKINFSEHLSTEGTISVNGVQVTPKSKDLAAGEVVLGNLEVGKTYKIDIVGATDAATTVNKAEHITLSVSVPARTVDTTVPTVSTSTSGNKLTLTFSEEVTKGAVSIGGVPVVATDITTTDNKTFVVDVQKANTGAYFANNANFFTSEVVVNGFADKASTPNAMKEVKFSSTFTADRSSASLVSAVAKADGTLELQFNEAVVSPAAISSLVVKSIDGIYQSATALTVTSAQHPVVNGKAETNKLVVTLDAGTQLAVGKSYVIELAKENVEDVYGNKNQNPVTISVVRPAQSGQIPGKVVTTTITENQNVIDVVFAATHVDGMTDSVLSPSNYTVGGKALPSNTDIKFVDNKNKVRITLPEGFVTVNGTFTFTASNLTDKLGNTLADGENTAQLALTENIAPTVISALTLNGSNEVVVGFSESISSTDLDTDGTLFEGISVKVNGAATTAFAPSVVNGKLQLILTNAVSMSDVITVDFNNAELTDANGNQVKNGVASK